jgi:hypothetical protein
MLSEGTILVYFSQVCYVYYQHQTCGSSCKNTYFKYKININLMP